MQRKLQRRIINQALLHCWSNSHLALLFLGYVVGLMALQALRPCLLLTIVVYMYNCTKLKFRTVHIILWMCVCCDCCLHTVYIHQSVCSFCLLQGWLGQIRNKITEFVLDFNDFFLALERWENHITCIIWQVVSNGPCLWTLFPQFSFDHS